jgi:hypothetical protein
MHVLIVTAALLQIAPPSSESLPFDLEALRKMEQTEVRVTEKGKSVVYRGVPMSVMLRGIVKDGKSMSELRSLSDAVVLVRASDGYQAAVSAAAVAMDQSGQRYLLAFERDGAALDKTHGPAQLIIPADSEHVRWVRMVSGVDLIRLKARPK